jgi:hypothetical protein
MSKAKTRTEQQREQILEESLPEGPELKDGRYKRDSLTETFVETPSLRTIQLALAGEGGIDLGDGWARIFTLNRFGLLQVCVTTRIEEEWLRGLSADYRSIKDMSIWPEGTLPKANPWKVPHFHKVSVCKPIWHEDIGQFQVSLDGDIFMEDPNMSEQARQRKLKRRASGRKPKGKREWSTLTYFFHPELCEDKHTPGFWTPRRQRQGIPWKRGDRVVRDVKAKVREFHSSDEYDLRWLRDARDGIITTMQCKTHLCCRHNQERPQMLVDDIKYMVEFWMEAIGLEPHKK